MSIDITTLKELFEKPIPEDQNMDWMYSPDWNDGYRAAVNEIRPQVLALIGLLEDASRRWISVEDRLPEIGQVVALRNESTYMNVPDAQGGGDGEEGVYWHGAGYLSEFGHKYWSVFGERRGMTLDSVTHWLPLPK